MLPLTDYLIAYIGPGVGFTFVGSFFILLTAFGLLLLSILTWPVRLVGQFFRRMRYKVVGKVRRVVVVGLDGLDPERTRKLIAEGKLPHLEALSQQGVFSELRTTLPPISPVAWSSFMTGTNPGKHNIFDFMNRDLRTYLPELSSTKITRHVSQGWRSWFGRSKSQLRLLRKSQPFWHILGKYGIHSTILRVPITFPPERFQGHLLSAMCTPDLRGTQGSFTFFTTNHDECEAATGGLYIPVSRIGNRIETVLPGPPNRPGKTPEDLSISLRFDLDSTGNRAILHVGREVVQLQCGEFSDWVPITFRCGLLTKIHGVCRFRLDQIEPDFRLYVSPINLDPERPAMPISHPPLYSVYLAKLHDTFATLGLAEDTWALNSGAISETAFLEQAYSIHDERERMFFDALERTRKGRCACVFDASDRIQHMFYRHDNSEHPANAEKDCLTHRNTIDEMYVRMDNLVGRVREKVDDDTLLLVLSDHGFCDFSRGVNLNVWLKEQGYLFLNDSEPSGDYFAGVDWSRTRAYAFGLSGIYLNLAGRESQGIVASGQEADELKAEITGKLMKLVDEQHSASPFKKIYDSRQAYFGPYVENSPDLIIGYNKGYRVSWETAVGRAKGEVFVDNTRNWSGDHCVDPELVPGVFFSNHKFSLTEAPSIVDLAPTILSFLGVPVPSYMDGVKRE